MLSLVLVKQFNDIIWLFSFYRFGLTSLTNVHFQLVISVISVKKQRKICCEIENPMKLECPLLYYLEWL